MQSEGLLFTRPLSLAAKPRAARTDDTGLPIENGAAVQQRTIRAVLWYEGERAGLELWYAGEIEKIDRLARRIESTGEAAVRVSAMADREPAAPQEALGSFLATKRPQAASQALAGAFWSRDATEVTEGSPQPTPTPLPTTE